MTTKNLLYLMIFLILVMTEKYVIILLTVGIKNVHVYIFLNPGLLLIKQYE